MGLRMETGRYKGKKKKDLRSTCGYGNAETLATVEMVVEVVVTFPVNVVVVVEKERTWVVVIV